MEQKTSHETNMIKDQYKNVPRYITTDIGLAATLMVKGYKLLYIEPTLKKVTMKPDLFHFVFQDDEQREQLVLLYTTNSQDLQVVPNTFRSTMRYLKEMTKNHQR